MQNDHQLPEENFEQEKLDYLDKVRQFIIKGYKSLNPAEVVPTLIEWMKSLIETDLNKETELVEMEFGGIMFQMIPFILKLSPQQLVELADNPTGHQIIEAVILTCSNETTSPRRLIEKRIAAARQELGL